MDSMMVFSPVFLLFCLTLLSPGSVSVFRVLGARWQHQSLGSSLILPRYHWRRRAAFKFSVFDHHQQCLISETSIRNFIFKLGMPKETNKTRTPRVIGKHSVPHIGELFHLNDSCQRTSSMYN